jgi:hypothetical protein
MMATEKTVIDEATSHRLSEKTTLAKSLVIPRRRE